LLKGDRPTARAMPPQTKRDRHFSGRVALAQTGQIAPWINEYRSNGGCFMLRIQSLLL